MTFRYEDEGELGRGGMSVVRRTYDPLLQRRTALKVLAAPGDLEVARQRFLDEARITGRLEHPNVVPVYEYGTDPQGRDFINMKLIEGQTLSERLKDQGERRLDPDALAESLEILARVCDAVAYAHHRGVVHRDLKPSNIMVGTFGQVYVVDWGIALQRDRTNAPPAPADASFGTPSYMAPEQIDGPDGVDPRADVYALGGILYTILSGRPPHAGKTAVARMTSAIYGRIRPPEQVDTDPRLPLALSRVAMRALSREPDQRFPDVLALKRAIEQFLRGAWHLPSRRYAAGEAIVTEGDAGSEAFVIQAGRCEVATASLGYIRELGPGDVFGELAILAGSPRTSTVRAIDDVEVLVVDREVLAEGLGLNSWMGRFVKALATRFEELEARLNQQGGAHR